MQHNREFHICKYIYHQIKSKAKQLKENAWMQKKTTISFIKLNWFFSRRLLTIIIIWCCSILYFFVVVSTVHDWVYWVWGWCNKFRLDLIDKTQYPYCICWIYRGIHVEMDRIPFKYIINGKKVFRKIQHKCLMRDQNYLKQRQSVQLTKNKTQQSECVTTKLFSAKCGSPQNSGRVSNCNCTLEGVSLHTKP